MRDKSCFTRSDFYDYLTPSKGLHSFCAPSKRTQHRSSFLLPGQAHFRLNRPSRSALWARFSLVVRLNFILIFADYGYNNQNQYSTTSYGAQGGAGGGGFMNGGGGSQENTGGASKVFRPHILTTSPKLTNAFRVTAKIRFAR